MENKYVIGNVISIDGLKIMVLINNQFNLETFHYNDVLYNGVSIGSYIGIIRGSNKIIARIEKEFLEDKQGNITSHEYFKGRFERKLEVSLIGNFFNDVFQFGVKTFPMIFNEVILLNQIEINKILQNCLSFKHFISIGKSVYNNVSIELAWTNIFNTHIGIFGNTGSGKSNTLSKIYTELFNVKYIDLNNKSNFFIIDFNGEYEGQELFVSKNKYKKKVIRLSTRYDTNNENKLHLTSKMFWNAEMLSILYSATEKTQKPFLEKVIDSLTKSVLYEITNKKIIDELGLAFYNTFKENNCKETLLFLNRNLKIIFDEEVSSELHEWLNCLWHSSSKTYYYNKDNINYINKFTEEQVKKERDKFKEKLDNKIIELLSETQRLIILINCHFIYYLSYGGIQSEHISPLLQRIETMSKFIDRTILIENKPMGWDTINIISLKDCDLKAKKIIPLLLVKQLYESHKEKFVGNKIDLTIHLIIDEAHNILSSQSNRESDSWKDYRLEIFEEIIKEGRKFGFFITLASQRPCDISPTIISQLHNYFIHRLVNDHDLNMVSNTISYMDYVSRNRIPTLAPGQCIMAGTSFEIPILVQIDKLTKEESPNSENADLKEIWIDKSRVLD